MFNFKSIKNQLIFYLLCFVIFLVIKDKDFAFLVTALVAVVSALAVEALVLYLKTRMFRITESAFITGLIVSYVISTDEVGWRFVVACALAIISKHLIHFHKKHIFNPAALGIFLTFILFNSSMQWKGTYIWYILVPFGFYFAYKLKKIEVIVGYAILSLLLFGTQELLQKISFWNIFGYFSYFYIFVMVIEPKTSPIDSLGRYLFGGGVAALTFVLTEIGVKFDAELFSLLVMNATVPLLNKLSPKGGAV